MSINYSSDVITSGSSEDTITIDSSNTLDDIAYSTMNSTYSITSGIGTGGGTFRFNGSNNYTTNNTAPWLTVATTPSNLEVKGDANFEGDIKWKGKSLQELFSKIEDRLAILQPDPAKLEKYEALRKAYEHYKLIEKLIGED
jgi:hypothetical protein